MKWLLVVIVMGSPVKTDLIFQTFVQCLSAESEMRRQWADVLNAVLKQQGAMGTWDESKQKNWTFVNNQVTSGTCIPAK